MELAFQTSNSKLTIDTLRIACANAESMLAAELGCYLPMPGEAKRALRNLFIACAALRRRVCYPDRADASHERVDRTALERSRCAAAWCHARGTGAWSRAAKKESAEHLGSRALLQIPQSKKPSPYKIVRCAERGGRAPR